MCESYYSPLWELSIFIFLFVTVGKIEKGLILEQHMVLIKSGRGNLLLSPYGRLFSINLLVTIKKKIHIKAIGTGRTCLLWLSVDFVVAIVMSKFTLNKFEQGLKLYMHERLIHFRIITWMGQVCLGLGKYMLRIGKIYHFNSLLLIFLWLTLIADVLIYFHSLFLAYALRLFMHIDLFYANVMEANTMGCYSFGPA